MTVGEPERSAATLGALVEPLGSALVRILAAPAGMDVEVGDVVIHDPIDPAAVHPADLVLAVGVDARRHDAVLLVESAGAAGAAGVVVKLAGDAPPGLLASAEGSGVALVAVDPEVAWGQLHALLRRARAAAAESGSDAAPVGDLFALANAVAAMVGGPTTIEDPRSSVLAYSQHDGPVDEGRRQTILGRRVPDEWLKRLTDDGVFKRLWASDEVVRVDYSGEGLAVRLAVRVRAGDEMLGSIWVAEGATPFPDDAERGLLEAARIAALHLIRHRSTDDLERGRRGELLRSALEGRLAPHLLAASLGLAADAPLTVAAMEVLAEEDAERQSLADRVINLVRLYGEAYRRPMACVAVGPVVYVLLPVGDGDRSDVLKAVADLAGRAEEVVGPGLRIGVGSTAEGLAGLLGSRRDADRALRAMSPAGVGPVAGIEHVRSWSVLLELGDAALADPALRAGRVEQLLAHDREKGTEYVPTLRAFLDAAGDVPLAAKGLGIHANTFRYRLRRLAEVATLDLDNPVERLITHLQLRWLDR